MKLLSYPNILKEFRKNILAAHSVDLAIAWITELRDSKALKILLEQTEQRSLKVRAIVGIDANFTRPKALQALANFADVRVIKGSRGIFHPKMYLFHRSDKMVAWIGSANFSDSGLIYNEELVAEFETEHEQAKQWFENKWQTISPTESKQHMEEYITSWSPPASVPLTQEREDFNYNWSEYIQQLHRRDQYWRLHSKNWEHPFSVLGDSDSYLETIANGHAITQYETWDNLSYPDAVKLLGLEHGASGLLGSMRGAGQVKHVFLEPKTDNLKIRQAVLKAVQSTIQVTGKKEYIKTVQSALHEILCHDRFGMGVATRLLALARPDMAISLNKASQKKLASLSDLKPTTLKEITNYIRLLEWTYELNWYNEPIPSDPLEKNIWTKRAALIDAFAYDDSNLY
jgi:HKD family nuclease